MKQIFSLLALVLLFSCKKENDHSHDVTTENIAGTYHLTAAVSQTNADAPVDEFAAMESCQKDDTFRFNTNGTFDYKDAGTQCSPPGDDNGTWSLPSNTQLIIGIHAFTIKSFDGRTLVLTASETYSGNTFTYTETLEK